MVMEPHIRINDKHVNVGEGGIYRPWLDHIHLVVPLIIFLAAFTSVFLDNALLKLSRRILTMSELAFPHQSVNTCICGHCHLCLTACNVCMAGSPRQ